VTHVANSIPPLGRGSHPLSLADALNLSLGMAGFDYLTSSQTGASALGLEDQVTNGALADPSTDICVNGDFSDGIGDSLVVNGDFATAATNLIANGTFTSSAGWSAETGWAIVTASNYAEKTAGVAGYLHSSQRPMYLTAGRMYRVTYTVANRSAGSVKAYVGTAAMTARSTNDTFTEDIICTSSASSDLHLKFYADATFDGRISAISISDVLSDLSWSWELDEGWTIASGKATANGADGGDITQSGILEVGGHYRVVFTVSGWSAGTVTAKCGTGAGTARGADDTFTEDIECAGTGDLIFTASALFDGSIDDVAVYDLDESGWSWELDEGWTLDTGNEKMTCDGSNGGDLTQAGLLTVGNQYQITFTTANRTAGTLTPKCGTGAGTAITADNTYTQIITCAGSGDLIFTADTDWDGDLDDVIVYDMTTETSWVWGAGWNTDTNKATKTAGSASDLAQTGILEVGEIYRVVFTVSGFSAGTVTPKCGTAAGTARGSDATFTEDIVCTGNTTFSLAASADFAGSVDSIAVYKGVGQHWCLVAVGGDATVSAWSYIGDNLPSVVLRDGAQLPGQFKMVDVTDGTLLAYRAE